MVRTRMVNIATAAKHNARPVFPSSVSAYPFDVMKEKYPMYGAACRR